MSKTPILTTQEIQININNLQNFLTESQLDGFYLSSFDEYLNEYTPLQDCHRYYVTGFTGSTAEVLFLKGKRPRLYVDGRYHEQADLEVDSSFVEVVKCSPDQSITHSLVSDIKKLSIKKLGYEADRISLSLVKSFAAETETVGFFDEECKKVLKTQKLPPPKPLKEIPRANRGRDALVKAQMILEKNKEAFFLTALDSIAWLTNCRGYHLPFLSSFYAKLLVTREKLYIFIQPEIDLKQSHFDVGLEFVSIPSNELSQKLQSIQNQLKLETVYFDPQSINARDYKTLLEIWGTERLQEKKNGVLPWQSLKEPVEMEEIRASFKKADQAIFQTISWVKNSMKLGNRITELDLYHQTSVQYQKQNAHDQSFNTIAGVGPNASIIHYSNPSDQVVIKNDDMILLDSGGYFDGGFATDTTRAFFAEWEGVAQPWQKQIYTLVLKGLLQCQNAVFPEGTKGNVLDGWARAPLYRAGFNYNHGTGHGVGIHVHEGGVSISPRSDLPMKAGQVVSIEPGIYLPGKGGVRLENIAHVIPHPSFKGMLCFEPLVYIGFDPLLIEESLLNDEEKLWLEEYEKRCIERKTSFRINKG